MKFARQITLPEIGSKGHNKIRKAEFTIMGVGSLGTWAALILGSMGAGDVKLIDRDIVDESNLYHQPLYKKNDVGEPKATASKKSLQEMFPQTKWETFDIDLNSNNMEKVKANVILDCTDNLETIYLLNEWCIKNKQPWVHAATIGVSGTVCSFLPGKACFKCLYPNAIAEETCETRGIFNPVASITASIQATEAIKISLGKEIDEGFIRINAIPLSVERISFRKNPFCLVCSQKKYEMLNKKPQKLITFCGGTVYQGYIEQKSMKIAYERRGPLTIFRDRRVLIKAGNEKQAKSILARYFPL